ncbi:Rubber elongation factor [Artemisia annua]|uniref:Rubber elongation factor n=1 Tax=Artemisia annua TaxID=35608 RepID=A0A2U1P2A4_ARTAN|nr:Rubber elongation factor [Artemisia annua]
MDSDCITQVVKRHSQYALAVLESMSFAKPIIVSLRRLLTVILTKLYYHVDESVTKFDSRVPPFVKQVSITTKSLSSKASEVKSAEQHAASAWHSLNQLPYFPQVANVVVPKAAYFFEKYDQTVHETAV